MVLPILAAALVALLVIAFSGTSTILSPQETASPSLANQQAAAGSSTASTAPRATPGKAAAPNPAEISKQHLTAAGANLLKSIVNIYCTPKNGSSLSGASGSGVFIDPRGLILTAAHIGEYFLLTDSPKRGLVSCVIRTGSPALTTYTAALVYLSPSWLKANSDTLVEKSPKGTGQDDFAILAVTGTTTDNALPKSFTYVPLGSDTPMIGERVAIGAYAAQYLASDTIRLFLFPTIVFDAITDRFTFDTNTVDVLAVKGTAAAQEGSSGGGVVDEHNQLVGLITTSSIKGDISEHVLNAITPRHIRASFAKDSSASLDSYLANNDLKTLVSNFSTEYKTLQKILVAAITR
jgi:S1-C subfamily serine protease